MHSIRRWFYRPKKEDSSCLAQFYWADEELNLVAAELDSFDGRKDPERCSALVNQLRICQDKVLTICSSIMDEAIPYLRANRDFQAKFPDDVLQENLAGQLWFGAECLAAGSNILNRELESASMRPLAKALTRALDNVRFLLREQCLRNPMEYSEKVKEALWIFDRLFADFEFCYVSAMVPVKSVDEYNLQQEVVVLFSETLQRALKNGLVPQEMVDDCDPSLMFTIPRLAIVCGLLIYPDGPLRVEANPSGMSELFRPFFNLLLKIRELLWTLTEEELQLLEKTLCSTEDPEVVLANARGETLCSSTSSSHICPTNDVSSMTWTAQATRQCDQTSYNSKQFIRDFYAHNFGCHQTSEEQQNQCNNNSLSANRVETPVPMIESKGGEATNNGVLTHQNNHHFFSTVFHHLGQRTEQDGELQHLVEKSPFDWSSRDEVSHSLPADSGSFLPPILSWEQMGSYSAAPPPANVRRRHSLISPSGQVQPASSRQQQRQSSSQAVYIPRVQALRQSESSATGNGSVSSCSSCRSHSSLASSDWDLRSYQSTETSSYESECQDDEEVALALQAAEIAACKRARAKFRDSTDLIHRLFVCISGVADQLQTNFASDLRNILKCVFEMNSSQPLTSDLPREKITMDGRGSCVPEFVQDHEGHLRIEHDMNVGDMSSPVLTPVEDFVEDDEPEGPSVDEAREAIDLAEDSNESLANNNTVYEDPPPWLPDGFSPDCMACNALFTLIRRRHHCRNCGKIFCARCSSNSIPLPRYGHLKPVRVCNPCFIFQVTQLLVESS